MKICVIGLGSVGLALVATALQEGHSVVGIDIDSKVIMSHEKKIMEAQTDYFEVNQSEYLILQDNQDNLVFYDAYELCDFENIDTYFITVNTMAVINAAKSIMPFIRKGDSVFLESTITPIQIKEVLIEFLKSGELDGFQDFNFIVSPERVMEGRLVEHFRTYHKIVGVVNDEAWKKAVEVYVGLGLKKKMLHRCTPEEAMMSKIIENCYRYWTIGFGHIAADVCRKTTNCNYDTVRKMVNTRPDRELPYSGIGIGGFCLDENMRYLIAYANQIFGEDEYPSYKLLDDLMWFEWDRPTYQVITSLRSLVGEEKLKDSKILIMGATYRPDGQSTMNSPSMLMADALEKYVKRLRIYDPYVDDKVSKILRGKCKDVMDLYNPDIIILTLGSEILRIAFEEVIIQYPNKIYVNLTQFQPKEINDDYLWLPY